jgi:prophage antirepressor-like protein
MSALAITIDGEALPVRPHDEHEYVLETRLVARGYGVNRRVIQEHKKEHADELVEGKHWVVGKTDTLGGEQSATFWTKRGILRLGFFIRSERAKRFRDAAARSNREEFA